MDSNDTIGIREAFLGGEDVGTSLTIHEVEPYAFHKYYFDGAVYYFITELHADNIHVLYISTELDDAKQEWVSLVVAEAAGGNKYYVEVVENMMNKAKAEAARQQSSHAKPAVLQLSDVQKPH